MTVTEVRAALESILDSGEIVLAENDQGRMAIDVEAFVERFGTADFTHAGLSAHAATTPGWQAIFDEWQTTGRLP